MGQQLRARSLAKFLLGRAKPKGTPDSRQTETGLQIASIEREQPLPVALSCGVVVDGTFRKGKAVMHTWLNFEFSFYAGLVE